MRDPPRSIATLEWSFFEVVGPAPVAYAVFGLALGLAAGSIVQRTVPAMAATLLAFVPARTAVHLWRPWLMPPLEVRLPAPASALEGAMQLSPGGGYGVQTDTLYQPADRFWTSQTAPAIRRTSPSRRCIDWRVVHASTTGRTRSTGRRWRVSSCGITRPPASGFPSDHIPSRREAARKRFGELLELALANA